jgi:outer membrane protein
MQVQAVPAAGAPSPTASGTQAPQTSVPGRRIVHLDDAVQIALKAQPLVLEAHAQTESAVGTAEQARAGLLPTVTGSALYERTYSSSGATPGATTNPNTNNGGNQGASAAAASLGAASWHNLFYMSANANQLLWDFNQTPDRFRAANRNVDSLRASEHTTELQVLLTVRKAFFTARADKDLVVVADETVKNEEKHVVQVKGFVAAGTQPEIALATELTNLANDKVALITAQNNYEIAKAQLNQSMGIVAGTDYDVAADGLPVIAGEDGPDERLVDDALKTRPELAALQKQVEADQLTIRSDKGAYGPTLSALGSAGASGVALDTLTPSWAIGAQLLWPIFQGGLTNGVVHTAEANLSYASAALEAEKLQVRFDVQQAVLTLRATKVAIDASREALTNAREQLRLAEGRYQSGVGSIIELGDAQIAATNAAAQVVQADFNLATARAQLLTALGRP